ncbi:MAG: hypothetical protein JOY79_11425, partial [Acidobacteriaceae bacterium]|nr:hypothetical protein [Acidobacteriaceae bacterium]
MRWLALLILTCCMAADAVAQSHSKHSTAGPARLELVAAQVSGSKRFAEADVIAEAGLKLGAPIT